jgi:hypothetical protein
MWCFLYSDRQWTFFFSTLERNMATFWYDLYLFSLWWINSIKFKICTVQIIYFKAWNIHNIWGCRGRDRIVIEFTTAYAISAYQHWCCEFEYWSGRGVQHYIKFVSDLRQVGGFLRVLRCPPLIKLTATI